MTKKHVKHPKIGKPELGNFVRNEISILGTTCARIAEMADHIYIGLPEKNVCYMDADHGIDHDSAAKSTLINKISHWQYNTKVNADIYGMSAHLREVDLLLVNGNHERANKQIVILDSAKEASLLKRKAQITDIMMILTHDTDNIPDFIKSKMADETMVISLSDVVSWVKVVKDWLLERIVPVYGLLLNGGKSTRMGQNKSDILIGGQSVLDRQYELLNKNCVKTFLSVRDDQQGNYVNKSCVTDRLRNMGPYGGILSAFMYNPNVAWLVLAVDLVKVTEEDIAYLINSRNPSKNATAFYNKETAFPDPLFTIWEPKSYGQLLHFLSLGFSCPRKVLINSDIAQIQVKNVNSLFNMNVPKDLDNLIKSNLD